MEDEVLAAAGGSGIPTIPSFTGGASGPATSGSTTTNNSGFNYKSGQGLSVTTMLVLLAGAVLAWLLLKK